MGVVKASLAIVLLAVIGEAVSQPLGNTETTDTGSGHSLWKRFVNPSLTSGGFDDAGLRKMRMKRSYASDCERLELCQLHARSGHGLFAAFQLYFVNKENARLWDHQTHSAADCARRFNCYK